MKTGMEYPMFGLLAIFVAFFAYSTWSAAQPALASAQVSALAAGEQLPAEVIPLAELGAGWMVKAAVGAVLCGFGAVLAHKIWRWWKRRELDSRRWNPGPNAGYGKRAQQVRAPGDAEMMRLAMYQQMLMQNGGRPPARMVMQDDEPESLTF